MKRDWPVMWLAALSAPVLADDAEAHRPASSEEQLQRAAVVVADYRFGDLLWENDLTAFRIYGKPLEQAEPPSTSGIDAWVKSVPWPFADRQLRTGDQHTDHGEGLDFYNVGVSRGAGGLGVWHENKLWTSRNYVRPNILMSGGDVADFTVDYDPWPVDITRKVWETRRFTLKAGEHFTRMVSTLESDSSEPIIVGIGLARRGVGGKEGAFAADTAAGRFTWWSQPDGDHGELGVAVLVDPATVVGVRRDFDNHLILLRVSPGQPFVYYVGTGWTHGRVAFDKDVWQRLVNEQSPSFAPFEGQE